MMDLEFEPVDVDAMFDSILSQIESFERVVLVGGPRAGKSTLTARAAERFKLKARHADALIRTHDWHDHSEAVAGWFSDPGKWVVEGVSTARALRKYLAATEGPVDFAVVYMPKAIQIRTDKQESMAKGVATTWGDVVTELELRGAKIIDSQCLPVPKDSAS